MQSSTSPASSTNSDISESTEAIREEIRSREDSINRVAGFAKFCAFVVVLGVVIEYLPIFRRFYENPNWLILREMLGGALVALGVSGELIASFVADRRDNALRRTNATIISKFGVRIAELTALAAELRTSRAQVELELARMKRHASVRLLSEQEIGLLKSAVSPFKGQFFWVVIESHSAGFSESKVFADQLKQILTDAGLVLATGRNLPEYHLVTMSGVEVHSTAITLPAATAIANALNDCGIAVRMMRFLEDHGTDYILIKVGPI